MKKYFGGIFVLILLVFLPLFAYFTSQSLAQETGSRDMELMRQGKVRTCLKAEFMGDRPHGYPAIQTATFNLKGFCDSPSGCACVWNQGKNEATARMEGECNDFKDENNCKVSKEELKARRSSKDKKVAKSANRCTSCGHTEADARNATLANLQPITQGCNIVQNKLAKNDGSSGKQVLGETTVLPYGPVDIIVKQDTARHTDSSFYAVGELGSTVTELGQGGGETGEAKTQQLGTIGFKTEDFESPNVETDCKTISWDPYGRVFDAQTLEPISDAEITLIDAQTNEPVVMQFEDNFDITGNDGVFNILVEKEGGYKLDASGYITDHEFLPNPNVNTLWSKIYSDLYSKGDTFIEKPRVPTHHDIALVSTKGPYHGAVAVLVGNSLKSTNMGEKMVYTGRVTFPFAKVCLKNEDSGQTVGKCVTANNIGSFSISVAKSQVPQSRLLVTASKVNLTDPNIYKGNATVETLNVGSSVAVDNPVKYYFDPVLSQIEGFVYADDGKVVPKANVSVKLKMDSQVFYQTKADDSGFFTIYAKNLPFFEYYLEFTDPVTGRKFSQTTSQFASLNEDYLSSKKINLVTAEKDGKPMVNETTGELNQIPDPVNKSDLREGAGSNNLNNPIKLEIVAVIFIIVILIFGALGIVIYIKRQGKSSA